MKIFMYNSMETTPVTRRASVSLIHEDDSEDVAGKVERPEVDLMYLKNTFSPRHWGCLHTIIHKYFHYIPITVWKCQLDNMWGALGQSFHTGQIYAARYPITPLFASKLVNFCTYFRHLCIIEKRHPLLSFLLATVVDIALHTVSETLQGHHCDARPNERYLQWLRVCHFLPFDSAIFANILVNNSTWGVSLVKNFVTKNFVWPWGICSTQFRVLNCNFFCSLGRFEGAKKAT